jgi:hypothetical protein
MEKGKQVFLSCCSRGFGKFNKNNQSDYRSNTTKNKLPHFNQVRAEPIGVLNNKVAKG